MVQWLALPRKKEWDYPPGLGPFCVGFLSQPKDLYVRLIVDCKLAVGVNVSPVVDWRPVQGAPHLWSYYSWDMLQNPHDPELDKQFRKYIDVWIIVSFLQSQYYFS